MTTNSLSLSSSQRKKRKSAAEHHRFRNAKGKLNSESIDDVHNFEKSRSKRKSNFLSKNEIKKLRVENFNLQSIQNVKNLNNRKLVQNSDLDQLKQYCGRMKEKLFSSQMKIYK